MAKRSSFLCTCGHFERAHDFEEHEGRCQRWKECGCLEFSLDDEATKALEDEIRIRTYEARTGK